MQELFGELDEDDKAKFYFDHTTIDWKEYHHQGIRQIRRLLLKEDDSTIPQGHEKVKKLYYANAMLKAFCGFMIAYVFITTAYKLIAPHV